MRDFTDDLRDLRRRVTDAHAYLRIDDARAASGRARGRGEPPRSLGRPRQGAARHHRDGDACATTSSSSTGSTPRLRRRDALRARPRRRRRLGRRRDRDGCEAARASELDQLELRALFSGEHDERDAICEVHSGAGGTDAQDWAEMLLRMYTRWAQQEGFEVEVDEPQRGNRKPASRRRRSS